MILYRKKPKVYSAHRTESLLIRKKKALAVFLAIEPAIFYMLVSAVTVVSANVLLHENHFIYACIMSFILGFVLPVYITFFSWSNKRKISENLYIEHMTYLFCKHKDLKKALFEIREVFPRKEERSVINRALFLMQESGRVESAIAHIESHFSGRKTKLLHRYILESRKRANYHPPAEILTCITTNPSLTQRSDAGRRQDRWIIFLCALVSMTICIVIEMMGKESGLLSASYESSCSRLFAYAVISIVFVVYELKENIQKGNFEKYKTIKVAAYLKELTFFLLVMPVPKAIAKSVAFSEWSIKKKVSKLAARLENDNSAEAYLEFADKFHDDKVKRIMEFLYAKSTEPYLAPVELTAMLRQLDEIMSKEVAKTMLVENRERTSLLLAPQLATFAMLFGNILSLIESVGRKI